MEIEIVTFVVKGSEKVGNRSVALLRVFSSSSVGYI